VVTFLRVGALVEMGAGVDMVSSKMVGAVGCGHPLFAATLQLRVRYAVAFTQSGYARQSDYSTKVIFRKY
jgi:hypothetical protein